MSLSLFDDQGQRESPWTSEDEAQFRRIYSLQRQKQAFVTALYGVVALILLALHATGASRILGMPRIVFTVVLVVLSAGFVIFTILNMRCPACDGDLGRHMLMNPYCRHCGLYLG